MTEQLSVFLDNRPGSLRALVATLADNKIDMKALSIADAADYGIARILVRDPEAVSKLLLSHGYVCRINHVLAVSADDTPGGLSRVVDLLGEYNITISYMYAFVLPETRTACAVIRVKDHARAEKLLGSSGIRLVGDSEIFG